MPEEKTCCGCHKTLPIDGFWIQKDGHPRWMCRDCDKAWCREYMNGGYKARYRARRSSDIKYFVQERINDWRKKPGPACDLTVEYLVALYEKQEGLCYFTEQPMVFNAGRGRALPSSLSLDRLEPTRGYVIGNVVWCSYLCNTMKQTMTEAEFYEMLQLILRVRDYRETLVENGL
ncbi:MAG: hypothetical protein ACFB50_14615 [Rubrobacteraceae bacterium]